VPCSFVNTYECYSKINFYFYLLLSVRFDAMTKRLFLSTNRRLILE